MKISQSEIDRHRYLERQRAERDAASLLEHAQLALQKGFEKGVLIGRIRLSQQLLHQPETSKEELLRLDVEDLMRLEEELTRQLTGKKEVNGSIPTDKS